MTLLQIMPETDQDEVLLRTRDDREIADALRSCSVAFDRWPVGGPITEDTASEEIEQRYQREISVLCERNGLRTVDVARLHPDETPEWAEKAAKARSAFLDEHRHAENEVRFFAHGRGCFYLRLNGKVHALVCEAGDLLSVPAGTRHWFDMGSRPDFVAIRFFEEEDGWIGDFTGATISSRFPSLDVLLTAAP
jgi:1,2-dihydroxy-3-keto-5-methylthiopentene dioxygenase